jgi:hypothetical protein
MHSRDMAALADRPARDMAALRYLERRRISDARQDSRASGLR